MRLHQVLALMVVIAVLVGGTLLWRNDHAQQASAPSTGVGQPSSGSSPEDQTRQAVSDLKHTVKELQSARDRDESRINDLQQQLSAEQGERKLLSDQVGGLAGRLDGLEKARAEYPARGRRR
jgi:uncharacterized protein HemX